jgi:hypothetical protein
MTTDHRTAAEIYWDCVMGPDRSPVAVADEFGLDATTDLDQWVSEAEEAAVAEGLEMTDADLDAGRAAAIRALTEAVRS